MSISVHLQNCSVDNVARVSPQLQVVGMIVREATVDFCAKHMTRKAQGKLMISMSRTVCVGSRVARCMSRWDC